MQTSNGVRKVLAEQITEMVSAIAVTGVAKVAHKWRRKMTTAVYAVSWGAVVTEHYIAETKGDTVREQALAEFLDTVVAQEMAELPGHSREAVVAYLRRGVVLSRLEAANIRQVFTDLTLHGLGPDEQRGMWAGMPFIRPASLGRARACLEMLVASGDASPAVLSQAETDYLLLSEKIDAFTAMCREVRPDYAGIADDEVCNEFDPDYLRCVHAGTRG